MGFYSIKFKEQSRILLCGPSGCGKTSFLYQLLKANFFDVPVEKVYYCYSVWQPLFDLMLKEIPNIEFFQGIPPFDDLDSQRHKLIIIDDLMDESASSQIVSDLFVKKSHHFRATVILILHNCFPNGKNMRTISLNANYMIIFKNVRSSDQIAYLGRQLFPGKSKLFVEAYQLATEEPFGYLIVDMTASTPDEVRLRSRALPHEGPTIVYKL